MRVEGAADVWVSARRRTFRNAATRSPRLGASGAGASSPSSPGTFVRSATRPEVVTPSHVPPASRSRPAHTSGASSHQCAGRVGRANDSSRFIASANEHGASPRGDAMNRNATHMRGRGGTRARARVTTRRGAVTRRGVVPRTRRGEESASRLDTREASDEMTPRAGVPSARIGSPAPNRPPVTRPPASAEPTAPGSPPPQPHAARAAAMSASVSPRARTRPRPPAPLPSRRAPRGPAPHARGNGRILTPVLARVP